MAVVAVKGLTSKIWYMPIFEPGMCWLVYTWFLKIVWEIVCVQPEVIIDLQHDIYNVI